MGEVPDLHVVLVEDLVVLVVLDHVSFDQFIVDYGGFHGLGVLLDLGLSLEGLTGVSVHLHKIVFLHLNLNF
jgi:hypothetical protein